MRPVLIFAAAAFFTAIRVANAADASPRALLDQYCVVCHNDKLQTGGLSLQTVDPSHPDQKAEIWEQVIRKVRSGLMPPPRIPRPDAAALNRFASQLESAIDRVALAHPNPGHAGLHRLNRTEYANAVRDILGLQIDSAIYLPPDDLSHDFDDAEIGNTSPTLMEGYLNAAGRISLDAIGDAHMGPQERTYHVSSAFTQRDHVEGTPFGSRGGIAVRHVFRADGEYQFKVAFQMAEQGVLWGETLGPGEQIEIAIDGRRVSLLDVDPKIDENSKVLMTPKIKVNAGSRIVSASFLRRNDAPDGDLLQQHERSIVDFSAGMTLGVTTIPHLKDLAIVGPYNPTGAGDTPSRRRIFICRPVGPADEVPCATRIITKLVRQAYRRPVTDEDIEPFIKIYADGRAAGDFDAGIRDALQAILAFPEFVFRLEAPPADLPPNTNYRIGDLDLATRLSFFLWRSVPDETLIDLASRNQLSDPAILEQQVRRMLADPRAESLATSFAEQWLGLRVLAHEQPDVSIYPDFDENLAHSMLRETQLFFDSIVRENRSLLDLLTANYTFVDERLARHYGIPDVAGPRFRRVVLTDPNRFGLLGQASVLTATSTPNRTSPVERGKWLLESILGVKVPPPPPNVPPLKENSAGKAPQTVREKLEEHRRNEPCASCHQIMDPIGFALENFDAVGAWRIHDSGENIDPIGQMYDGTRLDGPVTLRRAILARSDLFIRNFTVKLLTYALARGVDDSDMPVVRAIDRAAARQDDRFEAIVMEIVRSTPFQMGRTGPSAQ